MRDIWLPVARCPIREEHFAAAVAEYARTGRVDPGPAVQALEEEFARRLGVPREWVLSTQSCTAGMGVCFHFISSKVRAPAITWPGSYCMARDVEWYDMKPYASDRLTVVVDLFGAMETEEHVKEIAANRIYSTDGRLVIDAAHNVLAPNHGKLLKDRHVAAVVYSFGAVKQLSGMRGGMVVSPYVTTKWRAYRHYGVERGRVPEYPHGGNFDMTEFSAVLILEQLKTFEKDQEKKLELFERYKTGLEGVKVQHLRTGSGHLFPIWTEKRDLVRDALRFEGIETSVHYHMPVWLPPFEFPKSREWAQTELTLPLHAGMKVADVDEVCRIVAETVGTTGK